LVNIYLIGMPVCTHPVVR